MGKTHRKEPRGEFKKLKASSKKSKNKKTRKASKTNLTRQLKFASSHRAAINITEGRSAAMYMKEE